VCMYQFGLHEREKVELRHKISVVEGSLSAYAELYWRAAAANLRLHSLRVLESVVFRHSVSKNLWVWFFPIILPRLQPG
jgi:hypothetical protein